MSYSVSDAVKDILEGKNIRSVISSAVDEDRINGTYVKAWNKDISLFGQDILDFFKSKEKEFLSELAEIFDIGNSADYRIERSNIVLPSVGSSNEDMISLTFKVDAVGDFSDCVDGSNYATEAINSAFGDTEMYVSIKDKFNLEDREGRTKVKIIIDQREGNTAVITGSLFFFLNRNHPFNIHNYVIRTRRVQRSSRR